MPGKSESSAIPIVNSRSLLAALSVCPNQAKPTAVISGPVRLAGRRHHANSPVPMNDQPTSSSTTATSARSCSWLEPTVSVRQSTPKPAPPTASARREDSGGRVVSRRMNTHILAQLSVRRGRAAVEFYKEAFGAVEVYRVGGDDSNESVVSQLSVDGASFWVADEAPEHANFSPETVGGGTVRMLLIVEDPDAAVQRAGAAGAARGVSPRGGDGRGPGPGPPPLRPPPGGGGAARGGAPPGGLKPVPGPPAPP